MHPANPALVPMDFDTMEKVSIPPRYKNPMMFNCLVVPGDEPLKNSVLSIISVPDRSERMASTVCHSYKLTGLLTIRARPDPKLYLNSTLEFDKVRAMKSVDLVTSPAYSITPTEYMGKNVTLIEVVLVTPVN